MARKQIPKTVRFEVFKRDSFTCQYCGVQAPDAILEIDHIVPVSKGGDNSLLNLITSCRDCNRGKTNRELSDDTAVKAQKRQLDDLQQRKEIMEMMIQWKQELMGVEEMEIDAIDSYISSVTDYCLSTTGRATVRKHIKRFGFSEVYDATEIAFARYYNGTDRGFSNALYKIGGICYNRKKQRDDNAEQNIEGEHPGQ